MEVEKARPRSRLWALLVWILMIAASTVPLWECWNCEGTRKRWMMEAFGTSHGYELKDCLTCEGSGRIAMVRKLSRSSNRTGIGTPRNPEVEATETFRHIGEKIGKATSVWIRFTTETVESDGKSGASEGTLQLKSGNRMRFLHKCVHRCASHDQVCETEIVSDGTKIVEIDRLNGQVRERKERSVPPDLNARIAAGLLHAGVTTAQWTAREGRDPKREHPADWFKTAGKQSLTYRLIQTPPASAELWYDPATFRPVRLERSNDPGSRSTDIFQEFTVDADIPDDTFRSPPEK